MSSSCLGLEASPPKWKNFCRDSSDELRFIDESGGGACETFAWQCNALLAGVALVFAVASPADESFMNLLPDGIEEDTVQPLLSVFN